MKTYKIIVIFYLLSIPRVIFAQTEWSTPQRLDGEFKFKSAIASLPQNSYYVSVSGDDSAGTGSVENPWKTITFAISELQPDSLNPDTLIVLPGLYSPSATGETFPISMLSYLTLSGAGMDSTILDAEALLPDTLRRVINLIDVDNSVVEGFTITGGFASADTVLGFFDYFGGGILIVNSNSIELKYNKIYQNHAVSIFGGLGLGGGISIKQSSSIIAYSNIMSENDAFGDGSAGGGLDL